MDINTVAAGGGSRLFFRNGSFEELAEEINASIKGEKKSLDEIVYG